MLRPRPVRKVDFSDVRAHAAPQWEDGHLHDGRVGALRLGPRRRRLIRQRRLRANLQRLPGRCYQSNTNGERIAVKKNQELEL